MDDGLTTAAVSGNLPFVLAYQAAFEALGDPTRRAILELLVDGARPVGDLARQLPVSRPAVSQHLRVLKDAGLVTDRPAGTRRLYSVNPNGVAAMRSYLDSFWDQALVAFAAAVQQDDEEET